MGTFQIIGGRKTGGNVATYFCTPDGRVLHAIAGPVNARILLREAQWVLDIHEQAKKASKEDADYVKLVRQTHADRLAKDTEKPKLENPLQRPAPHHVPINPSPLSAAVHRLLAAHAGNDIDQVYTKVWEGILKEKVSNDPVGIQGLRR